MNVMDLIQEARKLSETERLYLMRALPDMLTEKSPDVQPRKRRLREYRGLGAHQYDDTDAQAYVDQLRSEWDERP